MEEKIYVRDEEKVYLGKIRKGGDGQVIFWAEKRGMTTKEIYDIFTKMVIMKKKTNR